MVQKVRNRPDTKTKREWCRRPLFARDNQIFLNKLLALQIRAAEKNFAKSPKFNQREVHKSWHGRRGLNLNIMCLMKIASFCNWTWGMRIPLRCISSAFKILLCHQFKVISGTSYHLDKYWAGIYYFPWVAWIWGEKIAFTCLLWVKKT